MVSSCLGFRKSRAADREPLLPQYRDDTERQRELHRKLHTYQMLRALGKGFMPSNEQAILNLRTLLAADVLNPDNPGLSESGRLLVRSSKKWIQQLIELLHHKNGADQLQDFLWYLSRSRLSVDVDDLASRAGKARARADTVAAYQSLRTVGSLLFTNSDFRLFLSDLNVIGREVFKDSAFTLSAVAEDAGRKLEPSAEEQEAVKRPGADGGPAPSTAELEENVAEVSKVMSNGVAKVAQEAENSLAEKITGDERETLIYRLKQATLKLRKRGDYTDSVSTLSLLIKRYAETYSRALQDTVSVAQEDVKENAEMDRALKNFGGLISLFGDPVQWRELQRRFQKLIEDGKNDPEFESFMTDVGNSLQELLTDPQFFDHAEDKFDELRKRARSMGSKSTLGEDVDRLLEQIKITYQSVISDRDVSLLIQTSLKIFSILSPVDSRINKDLVNDSIGVFVPLLIQAVQFLPIPRLEVSTPEIDLLLENLVLEPGKTVNHSSFLPYRLRVETYNDLDIRKARFRTVSTVSSSVHIKLNGFTLRADEVGFWLRAHSGLLRFADEGIASIQLDEEGIDIHIEVEIAKDRLESILELRAVRVHIHKLNYTLRRSKLSFLAWLFKPFVRPLLRRTVERQVAAAVADALHFANRELLFARERLRATRVADPHDLLTFVKAVAARLTPAEDPDLYTRVGVAEPGEGVFRGVYAPGSLVQMWTEEGARATERIEDGAERQDAWRNEIFDVIL